MFSLTRPIYNIKNSLSRGIMDYKKISGVKLIVFDMAGTVIDDTRIVYDTLYNTLDKYNIPVTKKDIQDNDGKNKYQVLDNIALNYFDITEYNIKREQLHKYFDKSLKEQFFYNTDNLTFINSYVPRLFSNLKKNNIKITLNTSYSYVIQKQIIHKLNLNDYIDDYIASDMVPQGRPAPYMINRLMENLNIDNPNVVLKIGDTPNDILEGKNARCGYVVGVLSGSSKIQDLRPHCPTDILYDITELNDSLYY